MFSHKSTKVPGNWEKIIYLSALLGKLYFQYQSWGMVTDIVHKTFGQGELSGHSMMQKIYDHSTRMQTLPKLAKQRRIKYGDPRGGYFAPQKDSKSVLVLTHSG